MDKKKEKKIYKTNKILLKKLLIGMVTIFVVVCIVFGLKLAKEIVYPQFWKKHDIQEFGFSLKIPKAYKEVEIVNNKLGISSAAFETETTIKV